MWKFSEKRPFFRADMAGLGKYHMGRYGRIRVYGVKEQLDLKRRDPKKFWNLIHSEILPGDKGKNFVFHE